MPPIKDPALLQQLNSGPPDVQPQPLPGQPVFGPTIQSPRLRSLDQRDTSLGFDAEQNARAWQSLKDEQARLRIAQEKAEADRIAREQSGGVDPTTSQAQAAQHVIALSGELDILDDVKKNAPQALRPGWLEKGVGIFTSDPDFQSWAKDPQRQRSSAAYRNVIESALWLKTGAAYNPEQLEGQVQALTPQMFDEQPVLDDKRKRLMAVIEGARVSAGAANLPAQQALDRLEAMTPTMYTATGAKEVIDQPEIVRPKGPNLRSEKRELDAEEKSIPLPEAMQENHRQFLRGIKERMAQGGPELQLDEYLEFRRSQAKEYGYPEDIDYKAASDYVKALNEGKPIFEEMPTATRKVGFLEGAMTKAAADEGILGDIYAGATGYTNAMGAGIPSLLAGEENREAKELLEQEHPISSMTGEVIGSIAPTVALEKGLSKGVTRLGAEEGGRLARIGSDVFANALYGGTKGAAEANEGDRLQAAGEEALWGAGGAGVARLGSKGVAELKPKEIRESLSMLDRQPIFDDTGKRIGWTKPVDLTALQRMGFGRAEEFIEPFPGIASQRQAAVDSFNLHQAADIVREIGEKLPRNTKPGQHALSTVATQLDNAYRAIEKRIGGQVDGIWLNTDLPAIRNKALAPRYGRPPSKTVKKVWQELENATNDLNINGVFDFASYKDFSSKVREIQVILGGKPSGITKNLTPAERRLLQAQAKELLGKAREMVTRIDPEAGARLKRIDTAYSKLMQARVVGEGPALKNRGVGAPEEWISAVKKTSTDKKALTEGKAWGQPKANAAMDIIGKKPTRGGSPLGAASIGYTAKAGAALGSILYIPGVKHLVQALTDGRLAARADGVMPEAFVKANPWAKELPSDVVKQVMASAIREQAANKEGTR